MTNHAPFGRAPNADEARARHVATYELFIRPGDFDWLVSRWMHIVGLWPLLAWHRAQATEKYLKAILLLNTAEIPRSGHNSPQLWAVAETILAEHDHGIDFSAPPAVGGVWTEECFDKWLSRMNERGNPDSRYGLLASGVEPDDFFKTDVALAQLRRYTVDLSLPVGVAWPPRNDEEQKYSGRPFSDFLRSDRNANVRPLPEFQGSYPIVGVESVNDLLRNWNVALTPNELAPATAPAAIASSGFRNPYIGWGLVLQAEASCEYKSAEAKAIAEWLIGTNALSSGAVEFLKSITRIKTK
ncbi:MAG: hypothetical protein ACK4OP_02980 [Gemmobacter sp.]